MATAVQVDLPLISLPVNAFTAEGFRVWQNACLADAQARWSPEHVILDFGDDDKLAIPATAATHPGFRDWARSDDYPRRGDISYLQNEIVIDMSPEEINTHNFLKSTVSTTVHGVCELDDLGLFFSDRTLFTNVRLGISVEPDASFVSWRSLKAGRLRLEPRGQRPGEFVEMEGAPDWVAEIISRSSLIYDSRRKRDLYHAAGVREYWLINALGEEIDFQMLVRRRDRYAAVRPRDGWRRSPVFGRSFRLSRTLGRMGLWRYRLEVRKQ